MLKNYLKIAWRNLVQNKSHSIINIVGLSIGMACCILIALYVNKEMNYDRYHVKSNRIMVMTRDHKFFGRGLNTPYPLATVLDDEVPSVQKTTRTRDISSLKLSRNGEEFIEVGQGTYADSNFFDLFSFELIRGNESDVLKSPDQIVLTQKVSQKLFGNENPVGESIYWDYRDSVRVMQVSGVINTPPETSTFDFDALISYKTADKVPEGWGGFTHRTFALLDRQISREQFSRQLASITNKNFNNEKVSYSFIPLESLHLSDLTKEEGFRGNINYIYLFGSIAAFILFIACVNYVNLATARVSQRVKEVGIRKTVGATQNQLAFQFLSESVLLSLGAFTFGILLTELALPYFNQLFGTSLALAENLSFIGWLGLGAVGVGLLAGWYPAFQLARFAPRSIFRRAVFEGSSRSLLRKFLVVSQFTIALVLIMSSLVVYRQLQYTQTKDLGFNENRLISVQVDNPRLWKIRDTIKQDIKEHTQLEKVSVTKTIPGGLNYYVGLKPEKFSPEEKASTDERISVTPFLVDQDYLEVMEIDLIAGRNFTERDRNKSQKAFILNKEAARQLGWSPEEAVGKPLNVHKEGKVIGVTSNFHIKSFRTKIDPVVLQIEPINLRGYPTFVLARLQPNRVSEGLKSLKSSLAKHAPNEAITYEFIDEKFETMYRTERRFGKITATFTIIAILISCMGLYGLASFAAERRTKEIGIRKVVGASMQQILWLLNKDFLKLVLMGFVIAVPIAWYTMHRWLQNFAYKMDIGAGVFLVAGCGALFIAILTVSWQSIKAALMNPAESVRMEG